MTSTGSSRVRAAARAAAAQVLDTLADPASTAGGPQWADLSLSNGFPGVSLAFSGSTPRRPDHVARAHGHLTRAITSLAGGEHPPAGGYSGPGAVAFAVLIAHRATGGYHSALTQLDEHQRSLVRSALPALTDAPLATNGVFEVVRGMAGIGRYLLARRDSSAAELDMVLRYLVALTQGDLLHQGHRVPRWWTPAPPTPGQRDELPDGHLNLGLSHGVSGPLALLALAWRDGVRVEGQREALESLVGLLRRWATEDRDGIRWPGYLTLEHWAAGPGRKVPRQRPSWCYGAPGMTRAVQLAALALDRSDWHDLAHRSLLPLLALPLDSWGIDAPGLCHGWSGVLHLMGLIGEHLHDERLARVRDELAVRLLADLPNRADEPGFLEGAAGIALALDAYAEGRALSGWDMPLLVS
ncbi:lanthionine synthetase C family protein [Streptomyces sp. NBC_01775]|uniref:lanthionine synthetase C family protein n=1 Tax=Streptomyces sp. NBC_01775 TaxID=2975939 RepID=UPI002DD99985|nr:lanthionine synthetase C family protein [Streptomyces sp. NBC_01775]WSB80521.1 lanthionine synthetase C family protein [Streptomyces sp. NBC_01775]